METFIPLLISIASAAFFSGMETAFASSNKMRFEMKKKDNLPSRILSVFFSHPKDFISTMWMGYTVSLVIYGILMTRFIEGYIPADVTMNRGALLVIETVIAALLILLLGEFMPKSLSKTNPHLTLRLFSLPAFVCYIVLYPFSRIATVLSIGILRLTGTRINKQDQELAFTKGDLDYFIQSSIEEAGGDEEHIDDEIKIFKNALDFSNIKIRDCMIPRTEIIAVESDTPVGELKNTFIENGISKIIVYKENIDNIVGYIHSSEMFRNTADWQKNIRSVPIVPETMGAHKLMCLFKQQKRSLAVVVDEFGGTSGIVAMEDLVEEILGDIEDEHDTNTIVAKAISENEYVFSGRLDIEKANGEFGLDLPESDGYQTIGGLILHEYQSIPKVNEMIRIGNFLFKIIRVTNTKIELVKLKVEK
ncbi:MAG TPA: hemolysin family protein [Candidatus Phocaeicola excrementigallinarum]|nr:hemolysin family protein [Candidatus Phocaeicola excrementigallinarum]